MKYCSLCRCGKRMWWIVLDVYIWSETESRALFAYSCRSWARSELGTKFESKGTWTKSWWERPRPSTFPLLMVLMHEVKPKSANCCLDNLDCYLRAMISSLLLLIVDLLKTKLCAIVYFLQQKKHPCSSTCNEKFLFGFLRYLKSCRRFYNAENLRQRLLHLF